tara:strand:- start:1776 stop:3071 length:1296 start_codon:yes stop_codon:yes gene_type:complete
MIKLKDILSESKFGHLVEKDKGKPLSDKDKQKIKDLGLVWKGKGYGKEKEKGILFKNVDGKLIQVDKKGKKGDTKKGDVFKKDDKPKSKKDQEKAQKTASKKEKKELEKIKKAKVVVREPGKPDKEIAIEDILSDPFGKAKDNDKHPQAKKAKKKVYEMYQERYGKEGRVEVKKRLKNKDKNGDPILTKEEQTLYEKEVERVKQENKENKNNEWYEEKPIPNKSSFLNDKITDEYNKKADYFDPNEEEFSDNNYWAEKSGGDEGMFGDFDFDDDDDFDFDDDFGDAKSDDFGQPLSKLGSKQQQSALELKVKVPVGSLKKVKLNSNHRVTNQDGNPTKLSVFQDEKSKKYYGIDDEGNIYENDTEDFRNIKEPTTDAKGFPGAVTSKGQSLIDKRAGKQKEDEYDKTSFADLLDLLGIDTDVDYTNPFAGN